MGSSFVRVLVVVAPYCAPVAPKDVIVSLSDNRLKVAGTEHHRYGFGCSQRLLKPGEFAAVFSGRRVIRGACFVLHHCDNGKPEPRLGLVIPKKQARSAVLRNAIKRQAREVFRLRQARLPDFDLILRLVRPVTSIDKSFLRNEIIELFERLYPA